MIKKLTLNIRQLDLDLSNPRATPQNDPIAALSSLLAVENDGEKVYELARDICETGTLDPGDRLYVMPSNIQGRYTVLDGNRRLAALSLLSGAGWIDREDIEITPSIRSRFKRLKTDFADRWPTEVDVVVFENREEADHFIRLRHTGENSGAGRSAWSALQIARFDNTGLWQCLESLRTSKLLSLAVLNQLNQSEFSITNFDRVVGSKEFQDRFGCSIGKSTFSAGDSTSGAMKALARVANDVATGRVSSRGEFGEIKNMLPYLDEIENAVGVENAREASTTSNGNKNSHQTEISRDLSNADKTSSQEGQSSASASASSSNPSNSSTTSPPPPVRKKRASKYLLSKQDLTTVTHQKCREIVMELKQAVSVEDAPYGCALLLRCLQELTAEKYLSTVMNEKAADRAANIEKAAKHLLSSKHATDPADKADIAENFMRFREAYGELSSAAHSKLTDLSAAHVRSTWTNLGGGMDLLWKRIHATEYEQSQKTTPYK